MTKASMFLFFILGIVTLLFTIVLFVLFAPLILTFFMAILPWLAGFFPLVTAFLIIWFILYAITAIGTGFYYFFAHPADVKEGGDYSLDAVEEDGVRQKGKREK